MRYEERKRPVATWLSNAQLEHFKAIAKANNVTPTAYLYAMIVDVLAEEGEKVSLPRHAIGPDVFAFLRKASTEELTPVPGSPSH